LTIDDLRKFVEGVASLAGPIGADVGDAFEDMHDHLVASILALMNLTEDEQLRSSLAMAWLVAYSHTMMAQASKENGALPGDLGARTGEIARRKQEREALIAATGPKITALLDPIFEAARQFADERL